MIERRRRLDQEIAIRALPFALAILPLGVAVADPGAQTRTASRGQEREILTYYGLRKLELDPNVTDEAKIREWRAFLVRSDEQVQYAKQAVERWKDAAELRMIEAIQTDERNPSILPKEKLDRWRRFEETYPHSKEARAVAKRLAFWREEETKRLIFAAEEVERARASKVDRIRAWALVLDWADHKDEARVADRRIVALRDQLFEEARGLDRIARVDPETRLMAWRDVLNGRPSAAQNAVAKRRIAAIGSSRR